MPHSQDVHPKEEVANSNSGAAPIAYSLSDPQQYWQSRLKYFEHHYGDHDGREKFKEAVCGDAEAWGVFAALLMTVGAAALAVGQQSFVGDYKWIVPHAYVIFNSASFGLSFIGVCAGIQKFAFFHNLPPHLMEDALQSSRLWDVEPFVYVAVICQGAGILMGVNLLFESEDYDAMAVAAISMLMVVISWRKQRESYKNLDIAVKSKQPQVQSL